MLICDSDLGSDIKARRSIASIGIIKEVLGGLIEVVECLLTRMAFGIAVVK